MKMTAETNRKRIYEKYKEILASVASEQTVTRIKTSRSERRDSFKNTVNTNGRPQTHTEREVEMEAACAVLSEQ
jgi:hypothetical protein